MIGLPDHDFDPDDLGRLADWAELVAIFGEGEVTTTDIADVLHNSELLETSWSHVEGSPQERAEQVAQETVREIRKRARRCASYPIRVINNSSIVCDDWDKHLCFTSLLLADIGRDFSALAGSVIPGGAFSMLFEKVTRACAQAICGGTSVRFGWPVEASWPKPIADRVARLAERFSVNTGSLASLKPHDKDLGLDVVARLGLGDDDHGSLVMLVQCATGKNWTGKKGEPSIDHWKTIVAWQASLVRGIAFPWRWRGSSRELGRKSLEFDGAVILDRLRLFSGGDPEESVDETDTKLLKTWCEGLLASLPTAV